MPLQQRRRPSQCPACLALLSKTLTLLVTLPLSLSYCRWGVRYVIGEYITRHHRPQQQAYEEALAKQQAGDTSIRVPHFDPDSYLDGNLKRIFSYGRYDVLEVQGYGFPPS